VGSAVPHANPHLTQSDNHTSPPSLHQAGFPSCHPTNQQRQSTEGMINRKKEKVRNTQLNCLKTLNKDDAYMLLSWQAIAKVHKVHWINAVSSLDGCQPLDQVNQLAS